MTDDFDRRPIKLEQISVEDVPKVIRRERDSSVAALPVVCPRSIAYEDQKACLLRRQPIQKVAVVGKRKLQIRIGERLSD